MSASTSGVICVTGAGRGIGRATAELLAGRGANVCVADLDAGEAHRVAARIRSNGGRATAAHCDVSTEDSVRSMIQDISTRGELQCLVNNAGIFPSQQRLPSVRIADFDQIMATNVRGPLICTLTALPLLVESRGHVIYVGSAGANPETALHPQGRLFPFYAASKAALQRLVASLALDLELLGISTSIFRPPATRTEGSSATGLATKHLAQMVDARLVAAALAWLAEQPSMTTAGEIFDFSGFGHSWGPNPPEPGVSPP